MWNHSVDGRDPINTFFNMTLDNCFLWSPNNKTVEISHVCSVFGQKKRWLSRLIEISMIFLRFELELNPLILRYAFIFRLKFDFELI